MICRTAKLTEVRRSQIPDPSRLSGSSRAARGAVRPAAIVAMGAS
jgi:hypothetical protein